MKVKIEQFPATNSNPVLNVANDGVILYSNEAGEPLLHEWGVRVRERLPAHIRDLVKRVISQNSPEKIEVNVGNKVYLVVFSPLPEQECVNISGFDISDQKKLDEKPHKSEEKYQKIFNLIEEGIAICELIMDEKDQPIDVIILEANPAYEKHSGLRREQVIGRPLKEVLPTLEPIWLDCCSKVTRTRTGTHFEEYNASLNKYFEVFAYPMEDNCFIAIYSDTTERKRAGEEIKNASNMLQLIMNNIPQAIFWKDCNSRYLGCNNVFSEDAGVQSPENIVGKTDYDLPWTVKQTAEYRECDLRVMKNDTPEYHIIEQQRTADGKLTWLDTNKIPLHDAKGNVIGILGTYEDITERKEAEESLRLLNLYNRSLIETSLDPLVTIGHDGKITDVNKATEQVTGYSRNELIGTDFSDYFTEPEKAKKVYQKVFDEGFVIDYELEIRNKNGKETPVLYNASEYKDESGNVIGVFAAARDITESRKAKEFLKRAHDTLEKKVKVRTAELEKAYNSLKESEKSLAEAQEMAHIGNWEWDIFNDKAYWSEEMYRIFKRDPQKFAPSLKEYYSYIHPDDLDYYCKVNDYIKKVPTSGLDFRIVLANGEERTLHIKSDFIFDDKNNLIRVKGIVQDITESKRVEEKLRESEEKYRNIVETANEGISLIDNELKLTYVNKKIEDMIGYSSEEIIGKPMWDFISEESKPFVRSVLERGLGDFENPEFKYIRKDGSSLWAQVNAKPIFNNEGKFMGIMTMLTDITKRKEAEETLKNIEIARKQEIHHRIKNNLQVISSLLDLQAEKFRGNKNIENSQVLEAFRESQDRVISMALIHEELHKGKQIDTINISNYIEDLADHLLLTYRVGNTNIVLDTDIEKDIFFDMDTAVPLGIIVNELISNSLKHAFPNRNNGEIQIKLHRENGECGIEESRSTTFNLSVADNGVGIPEDSDIEDIDSLGLQLVTTLVEQLDGELKLRKDNGSKFTIRFMVTENSNSVSVPTIQQSV